MRLQVKEQAAKLGDPSSLATTLLIIAADGLDGEFLTWDPETIRRELQDTFQTELPPANFNKLMAAVQLITTDGFYQDLPDFIAICNTLYNGTFNPTTFDPADAGEIAWGITESLLIWPPDPKEENPFTDEILAYIGKAIRDEGIMIPPDVLRLGLPGGQDMWSQVQGTFSDDPAMFGAIYEVEKSKTAEINQMVKARLRALLEQLDGLQLADGDARSLAVDMLQALQQKAKASDKLRPT